jgi:glycosyltransferase involved in cell wall biosynthesis
MLENRPLVSVVIPFYNTDPLFMKEAIESVISQSYIEWELLLVDDGSVQASTDVALEYSVRYPSKIYYLEHEGHQNKGTSISRQLGIDSATGELVAFLDADDVWLPTKLEQQVNLMEENPDAGMSYGNTLYWYSWNKAEEGVRQDYVPKLGFKLEGLFRPGQLLPLQLSGKTIVPCTCSVIIRRDILVTSGGMEGSFTGLYDDQAFYAKVSLLTPVYVSTQCWDKYRQHSSSMCAISERQGQSGAARLNYLIWLERYLIEEAIDDPHVWQSLKREMWLQNRAGSASKNQIVKRLKKWMLKLEEFLLPAALRRWIWLGDQFK